MPVLEQLTDVSDKFFDAAVSTNDKAHDAAKNLVTRIQDADVKVPLADKLPEIDLPEPLDAVDAYFSFVGEGIELNRKFATKLIDLVNDSQTSAAKPAPKKTTAKKTTAKKATPAKTTAKKATPKKK